MYYSDNGNDTINRANLDGSSNETLVSSTGQVYRLDLDLTNGKIYWINTANDLIRRSNLDGTSVENILSFNFASGDIEAMMLDEVTGYIYFTEQTSGNVVRTNIDGTSSLTLSTTSAGDITLYTK